MKKKKHITAFYLEALLMIVVFISIILVLTKVFGSARSQSTSAKRLTEAVTLAQNTAEAVSASRTPQDLQQILGGSTYAELELAEDTGEDAGVDGAEVTTYFDGDMHAVAVSEQASLKETTGGLVVQTRWVPASGARAGMIDAQITVRDASTDSVVYELETSVYSPAE